VISISLIYLIKSSTSGNNRTHWESLKARERLREGMY
jgi:hypothetical protein